jgi:hypothetical protein
MPPPIYTKQFVKDLMKDGNRGAQGLFPTIHCISSFLGGQAAPTLFE